MNLPITAAELAQLNPAQWDDPPAAGVPVVDYRTPEEWGELVRADLAKSVQGIIDAGRHLAESKGQVKHGQFESTVCAKAGITRQTAHKLMTVADHPGISNDAHGRHLPTSWGTLYELRKLDTPEFDAAIADGRVTPDLERKQARQVVAEYRAIGTTERVVEPETPVPAPGQVATIVADPPYNAGKAGR